MKKCDVDMCSGPLLKKIIVFSVPLILSGVLQLLFNTADVIVVGRFSGKTALAAVGSTGSLTNLIVNLFLGLSIGTSVCVAQGLGAHDDKSVSETVHTSVALSVLCGILCSVLGISLARSALTLMDSPADVIDQATLYMRIYFAGLPASMLFNFGSAVLRATGDTKRPLYFLIVAGIVNVALNLVFVIRLDMGVAGVAIATIISQVISATLVTICLVKLDGPCHLDFKKIKLHGKRLKRIIIIGLPAGLQSVLFSISNVMIQSGINSFGSDTMAGNAAASNLDGFIYTSMNSVSQSALAFTGQNVGAKKFGRINRVCGISSAIAVTVGIVVGGIMVIFGKTLLGIYTPDPNVIEIGMIRLYIMGSTYFFCGLMDVLCGEMRGMGQSVLPMAVSVLGVCGLRIIWILTAFNKMHTLEILYLSYPITWITADAAHLVCYFVVKRRLEKRDGALPSSHTEATK